MRTYNCERCYRRKGKCDRLKPCTSCARAQANCTYPEPASRRPRPRPRIHHTVESTPSPTVARPRSFSPRPDAVPGLPRADPVSEISFLSLNAAGEQRAYLGSSSGLLLADLVRSHLDATVTRRATPQSVAETSDVASLACSRRDEDLPPECSATALFRAYLNHDAIIYPFMLPSFLMETVHRFYRDPGYYVSRATAFETFSFNMVLAIATSRVQRCQWQIESSPIVYSSRALRELSALLSDRSTERLQAMLLLCQYRLSSPINDNSASMWHLVGITARLSLELGLHREASYPIAAVDDQSTPQMVANYHDQEIRRRCFWTLMSMDRIVSIVLGRPFALHDDDVDTQLPSENSDRTMARAHDPLGVARIAVANKIFKYRLLCGQISTRLHGKKFETSSREEIGRATQTLADQLHEWHESQPQMHELHVPDHGRDQLSCYLSAKWYDLLAANASLMLWRPHFLLPEFGNNGQVLDRVLASASSAIAIYTDLHRSRKINYNWITLQSVFLAGLSYVSTVNQHFRQRRTSAAPRLTRDPSPGDIVRTTRACSKVLVALGERWDLPSHCHEVFDRLSDGALVDAIHYDMAAKHASSLYATLPTEVSNGLHWSNGEVSGNYSPHLTGDNEFMSCFDDLQRFYDDQYLNDSAMDLSQDWLGSLGVQSGT